MLKFLGRVLFEEAPSAPLGSLLLLAGVVFFIYGCLNYAKGKGYSEGLGFFLGLFSIIGLLILAFLPDRYKAAKSLQRSADSEIIAGGAEDNQENRPNNRVEEDTPKATTSKTLIVDISTKKKNEGNCLHCGRYVIATSEGLCPACRKPFKGD